uniref:Uncharacterized protein n=1 Tax=Mycobacterium leprae TaxID=1769 RepID=Q49892_MYCLR|nr:unknown [Mycobacterium leprae]
MARFSAALAPDGSGTLLAGRDGRRRESRRAVARPMLAWPPRSAPSITSMPNLGGSPRSWVCTTCSVAAIPGSTASDTGLPRSPCPSRFGPQ